MEMLDQNMLTFIDALSSSAPVPGGGGACGAVGAMAMALGMMVANLTTGKKKYAQNEPRIQEILKEAEMLRDTFAGFADRDAKAFEPLAKAYGLPKSTPEEIAYKNEVMEKCLFAAAKSPLDLMEELVKAMKIIDELSVIGSRIAVSDVGVAIQFAHAALNGSALNVFINTKMMKNREVAEAMNARADELYLVGNAQAKETYSRVKSLLRGEV